MTIKDIKFYPIDFNSLRRNKAIGIHCSIITVIHTDNGLIGVGEAPVDYEIHGHTLVSTLEWFKLYRNALLGRDELNLSLVESIIEKIDGERCGCNTAKAAIDMAVYDIIGKYRRCPVHQIIGGAYRDQIELMLRLDDGGIASTVSNAKAALDAGFYGLTIKLDGANKNNSLAQHILKSTILVRDILNLVDEKIYVCVDAGQSLENSALVCRMISNLFEKRFFSNFSLRQPLSKDDYVGHASIREKISAPLQLSISVDSDKSMMQIELLKSADRIALSLERVGGIKQAMRIVDICESASIGIHPQVNSLTPIGLSAHLHLAAAIHDAFPVEISNGFEFENSLIKTFYKASKSTIAFENLPGLGIQINEDELNLAAFTS